MPPKRKTEAVPEPSPPAKKRSTKAAPSSDKKRAREEAPEGSTKGRKSKKVVEEEEEEEKESPLTPVVTTATKAKRGSKVAPTTPPTKGKATPPPSMPKSALKTTNSKPRARKTVVHMELPPEVNSAKKPSTPEAKTAAASPKSSRRSAHVTEEPAESSHEASSSADEIEITSLWNQTWGALYMCLVTIGPLFFAIVMLCYFVGTLQQSQAIASVGVVYTLLFITIMGSYTLVILPCILIARLFTSIVSPHAPCHTPEEINLYSRLLVLIGVAAGLTYHFVSHHA